MCSSDLEKTKLLDEYDHRCAICRHKCKRFEWDHIERFAESWGDQHFQPLCPGCHADKTSTESRSLDSDFVASHFERTAWGQYVLSPRPPPLVYKFKDLPEEDANACEIADAKRCRRNALLYNVHPIPVFCPLDEIKPRTECVLDDFNFVTKNTLISRHS